MLACEFGCKNWYTGPTERPKGMRRDTFDKKTEEHALLVDRAMRLIRPRIARADRRGQVDQLGAMLRAGM
jgi:hypothetical protein